MTKIGIMLGGPGASIPFLNEEIKKTAQWIGVDYGTIRLLEAGMIPMTAIGDFDSVNNEEWEMINRKVKDVKTFPSEKDDTDTELAIQLALTTYQASEIILYGATAGRMDHLLSNLFLVLQPRFKQHAQKIHLIDLQNTISFYLPGSYQIEKEADKKYLAFVCMTPVKALSLVRTKYPLKEKDFDYPISLASNEFLEETAEFSFTEGIVAVIQSKDNSEKGS